MSDGARDVVAANQRPDVLLRVVSVLVLRRLGRVFALSTDERHATAAWRRAVSEAARLTRKPLRCGLPGSCDESWRECSSPTTTTTRNARNGVDWIWPWSPKRHETILRRLVEAVGQVEAVQSNVSAGVGRLGMSRPRRSAAFGRGSTSGRTQRTCSLPDAK